MHGVAAWATLRSLLHDESAIAHMSTELLAKPISNAQARRALERVAAERAALGRVAMLVTEGAPPSEVFAAVATEVAGLFAVPLVGLFRYETNRTATLIAASGKFSPYVGRAWRFAADDPSVIASLLRTGRPLRIDHYPEVGSTGLETVRELGVGAAIGVPVILDGRVWGAVTMGVAKDRPPLPADTVDHVTAFTDLVATAISNAETRTELTASRARVVAAADGTRRQLERDLHDGIQQRLVSLALKAREIATTTLELSREVQDELSLLADGLTATLDELREISRGIHPAVLSDAGLAPALKALVRRSSVPISLDLNLDWRLAEPVEVAAYYVASEALTNALKHAQASVIEVRVDCRDDELVISVRDDGIGGADRSRGSGIIGLTDRVEALGGKISVVSPSGHGTTLYVQLPVHCCAPVR
jgi:signal transduction histidine kinase